jgi:hypothetical protein
MKWSLYSAVAVLLFVGSVARADDKPDDKKADPPSYSKDVKPILTKYCSNCHNAKTPRSGFSFDNFEDLTKGGRKGPSVVANEPDKSVLIRVMTGKGKKMPPAKNRNQPKAEEIDMLKAWINAGAKDDTDKGDAEKKGDADKKGEKSGAVPTSPGFFARVFAAILTEDTAELEAYQHE